MLPKVLTAVISAIILSAVLGSPPCGAASAKKPKAVSAETTRSGPSNDLNSPAMDFSGAKPMLDNPHPDLVPPKKNRNEFFDQTIR